MYSLWQDLSHGTVILDLVTLTRRLTYFRKNFNLCYYLVMVAARRASLSSDNSYLNLYPIILLDIKPLITIKPSWLSGLRRWADFPVVDWRGVGSNPAGDIYFYFEFFAPSLFQTGQRSCCKWNQACPFTWSHSCFRPQIWFIIQGLVYKYLQYSFKFLCREYSGFVKGGAIKMGQWPSCY